MLESTKMSLLWSSQLGMPALPVSVKKNKKNKKTFDKLFKKTKFSTDL